LRENPVLQFLRFPLSRIEEHFAERGERVFSSAVLIFSVRLAGIKFLWLLDLVPSKSYNVFAK